MKNRAQSAIKKIKMKTIFLGFLVTNSVFCASNQTNNQEPQESFKDKVEVVAIMVKDTVTDTADTVKRSVNAGAEVAKDFIASTAARVKIALQEARAKQAEKKAREAREENEKAQKALAETQEQLKAAQAALKQTQQAMYIKK